MSLPTKRGGINAGSGVESGGRFGKLTITRRGVLADSAGLIALAKAAADRKSLYLPTGAGMTNLSM
jgi:hypothetical protein